MSKEILLAEDVVLTCAGGSSRRAAKSKVVSTRALRGAAGVVVRRGIQSHCAYEAQKMLHRLQKTSASTLLRQRKFESASRNFTTAAQDRGSTMRDFSEAARNNSRITPYSVVAGKESQHKTRKPSTGLMATFGYDRRRCRTCSLDRGRRNQNHSLSHARRQRWP